MCVEILFTPVEQDKISLTASMMYERQDTYYNHYDDLYSPASHRPYVFDKDDKVSRSLHFSSSALCFVSGFVFVQCTLFCLWHCLCSATHTESMSPGSTSH